MSFQPFFLIANVSVIKGLVSIMRIRYSMYLYSTICEISRAKAKVPMSCD